MLWFFLIGCGGDTEPKTKSPGGEESTDTGWVDTSQVPTASTGDTAAVDPCTVGSLVYEPGVGPYQVHPLEDGGVLTVIQGPQGGYHIDVAGFVSPVPDVGIIVRPVLRLSDGEILAGEGDVIQSAFSTYSADTCRGAFADARMFVLSDAVALCGHEGEPVTFSIEVEDFAGRSQQVELGLTLTIDLLDPYTCSSLP